MLLDFLFPRQCVSCKQTGDYLCKQCKTQLTPHPELCPYCHRYATDYFTCWDCRGRQHNALEGIIIPFVYANVLKKLILKIKYYHKKDVGQFLIDRMAIAQQANQTLQKQIAHKKIIISSVPSHRRRKHIVKGYNQSEILAQGLATKLSISYQQLLRKTKHTRSQTNLSRRQRLHNLKGAYQCMTNTLTENEVIMLVDDITTTGSTLNECAKTIKKHYPDTKIRGMVLGRHHG